MAEKKEKQYVSDNVQLMAEWDWEKNRELQIDPTKLTCGSGMKVWWKCCNGHSWQATINNRNNGRGCPYCAGKKVLVGYNDLQTTDPTLAAEWNYGRNEHSKPEDFTENSNKKVWWKCSKGHEWQAIIADRHSGTGCPYCSNQKVLKGLNDLQTANQTLAAEWNYEKNIDLRPDGFTANSGEKVWWRCSNGHEWKAAINGRNKGAGCPFCAGQKVLVGYNDLQTVNPTLAAEWNYEKNGELNPYDFTANSGKRVWWKCSKGHEWQTAINNRNNGNGCPICSSERKTSFPEYALVYYLGQYGFEPVHLFTEFGYELDVYIPSQKIAIEYDGYLWHKNKIQNDLRKNQQCQRDGIKLYRIREDLLPLNDSSVDFVVQRNQKDLARILSEMLCEITGLIVDINLERDSIAIENLRQHTEKEHSLLTINPDLALEWNYDKNGSIRPEGVLPNSNKKVWWKCKAGHEWIAMINSRNKGNGCPFCAGQKALKGYNDLQTVNPTLATEWNYEKNIGLTPADVMPNSDKKVWWKCIDGHEWESSINHRNNGRNCPYCSGKKVLEGYNDLRTVNPPLAAEWDAEKNGHLKPEDCTSNSHKRVWWKCEEGHEWLAAIDSRNRGTNCPYCSGRNAVRGKNDLKTINPALAAEWNYEKNSSLKPEDFLANSHQKVWWICKEGHEWQAIIKNRNKGTGCPECYRKRK